MLLPPVATMFSTPEDTCTHQEPWASIVRIGLRSTAVQICGHLAVDYDPAEFQSTVFNHLTPRQKIAMLAVVGRALLDPAVPAPELTAVVDSTLRTIVDQFVAQLAIEADSDADAPPRDESGPFIDCRAAMLAAASPGWSVRECGPLPDVNSCNHEAWEELAEMLYDVFLYDEDCEMEQFFVDDAPETADSLKRDMGILPNYFWTPALDPPAAELAELVRKLEQLTGEKLNAAFLRE